MKLSEITKSNLNDAQKIMVVLKALFAGLEVRLGDWSVVLAQSNGGGYVPTVIMGHSKNGVQLEDRVLNSGFSFEAITQLAQDMDEETYKDLCRALIRADK